MEGCENLQFTQHAIIEFLTVKNILPINIQRCVQAVYGDKCVEVSTVGHWVWQFKQEEVGEESLCDKSSSRRSVTTTDESHQESIEEMIQENC